MKIPEHICLSIAALLAPYGITKAEIQRSLTALYEKQAKHKQYLTMTEACQFCSVSRFTLRRWVKSNLVKAIKLSPARGGKVLIEADSLFAFLESHKVMCELNK